MGAHKLQSTVVRDALRHIEVKRLARIQHSRSAAIYHRIPGRASYSKRGQPGETWRTKRWTEARRQTREEDLAMARDRAAKAADHAQHIARQGDDPHPRAQYVALPRYWG